MAQQQMTKNRSEFEIELTSTHPSAYPSIKPTAPSTVQSSSSSVGNSDEGKPSEPPVLTASPEVKSSLHQSKRNRPSISKSDADLEISYTIRKSSSDDSAASRSYCDDRLHLLNVGRRSKVQADNVFAASALSLYLVAEHPLFGFFDLDLFLDDLIAVKTQFCTSILFNAVMFRACQMYTAMDSRALEYGRAFQMDAQKLWEAGSSNQQPDSLTSVTALHLLSLGCLCEGKNEEGLKYLADGTSMGERMQLFGATAVPSDLHTNDLAGNEAKARTQCAWSTYTWLMIHALFYHSPGISPPKDQIPKLITAHSNGLTGTNEVERSTTNFVDQTFENMCKLAVFIHEMTSNYYKKMGRPLMSRISLDSAESVYQKVLAWSNILPEALTRADPPFDHMVIFQSLYHMTILDILRPFTNADLHFRTFSASDCTPESASRVSIKQLKHIIRTYALDCKSREYNNWWHGLYLCVANALLNDPEETERRVYFELCVQGISNLYPSAQVAKVMLQGLFSMAIEKHFLSAAECAALLDQFRDQRGLVESPEGLHGTFFVDQNLSLTDPSKATAAELADKFEELFLFNRFTSGDDFENT
ncbi:hypothetical protein ACLMJK_009217 [Lecanora helva]